MEEGLSGYNRTFSFTKEKSQIKLSKMELETCPN